MPPLGLVSSGSIECAACPARRARARSALNLRSAKDRALESPARATGKLRAEKIRRRRIRAQDYRLEIRPGHDEGAQHARVRRPVLAEPVILGPNPPSPRRIFSALSFP